MLLFKGLFIKGDKSEISFEQRIVSFIVFSGEISLLIAMLFDIAIDENIIEIITLAMLLAALPISAYICLRLNKAAACVKLQIFFLVFLVMPVTFFFGGGPRGGGIIWTAITYMYIGVVLTGAWKTAMTASLTLVVISEYAMYYFDPNLIYNHNDIEFIIDTLVSIILVGGMIYSMVWFQGIMYREERLRAQAETRRAEELNRTQNQFFSSMSHEIRTPINSILGLNEIIMRQEDASEEIKKDAANIQGAGKMLLALVNDILDISKIEAGKMDIVPVNYSVGSLVSDIVNMVWLRAEQKGLKVEVDIDPSIPSELYGDEMRIKQILINLLNNAIKYTNEGTVSLHIEKEAEEDYKVQLIISVSDTGIGIRQDALPYLFDTFRRVDEERNRYIEGTGLGLSIVKQLVELMDGSIDVNSVFGQGSTFTVTLWQAVTNNNPLGAVELSGIGDPSYEQRYKSGFSAPDARILIVDDSPINLEVEKRLLDDTDMLVDTASGGVKALEMTLRSRYDLIFMDHLMPDMDGLECLSRIRKQSGGLNNSAPVIVLTANAGGENRSLYNKSGFDGYLVKPVSGRQLEEIIIKHLPKEKVILSKAAEFSGIEMNTASGYRRKVPILITTSSMSDLPLSMIRELNIDIIHFNIHMGDHTFWDNLEADADGLIDYMKEDDVEFFSEPPVVEDYERFFASKLKKTHRIIHIAITSSMSVEYERALAAAKNFDNVTIVNSEKLSSATGLLVLAAYQMAKQNEPVEKIVEELELLKKRINCSFVIAGTDFMMRRGFIGQKVHMILKSLNIRPCIQVKNNKYGVGGLFFGNRKKCFEKYIAYALSKKASPDLDILFVTYVDVTVEELAWIEKEIKKRFDFKHIVFQKASAGISLNSGPGTFGLLYMDKGKNSYNLSSLLTKEIEPHDNENDEVRDLTDDGYPVMRQAHYGAARSEDMDMGYIPGIRETGSNRRQALRELPWYKKIDGIDGDTAIGNNASEDALNMVLKMFYETITEREKELNDYYEAKDWGRYTVKVHALKSAAKLIGAMKLSEEAAGLEKAGKVEDVDYIRSNHHSTMKEYRRYLDILGELYDNTDGNREVPGDDTDVKIADMDLLRYVYDRIHRGAGELDSDRIEEAFRVLDGYMVPEEEIEFFESLKKMHDNFDYDGLYSAIENRGGVG